MKLIEKKCPNCGAQLTFGDNDKSCQCKYCKSSYEIERENTSSTGNNEYKYNLSELKGPAKAVGIYLLGSFAVSSIIFGLIFFSIIGISGYFIYKEVKKQFNNNPYANIAEISNSNLKFLDMNAHDIIYRKDGLETSKSSFNLSLNIKREKAYIIYNKNENENKLLMVYKCIYENKNNINDSYTVYIPITYENVLHNDEFEFIKEGNVEAPVFCFNSSENNCVYAYKDISTFENEVIKPLKKDNTVSSK